MLKKFVISVCLPLPLLMILGGALIWYEAFAERSATQRANTLCFIKPGVPTVGIREQAISMGVDERDAQWVSDTTDEQHLIAIFPGFLPFSRHICTVTAKGGHVIKTEVTYLD